MPVAPVSLGEPKVPEALERLWVDVGAPHRQIENKSSSDSGDQIRRKLPFGMSGVGASDQILDVEFLPDLGVEGANARVKLLAKRGELIDDLRGDA